MDEDTFFYLIEPEDRPFVDIVYKAGRYNGCGSLSREMIEFIINAEQLELDPETIITEIRKRLLYRLAMYESLGKTIKERLSNEY